MSKANTQLATFMIERLKHSRLIRLSRTEKAEAAAFYKLSQRLSEESLQQKARGHAHGARTGAGGGGGGLFDAVCR